MSGPSVLSAPRRRGSPSTVEADVRDEHDLMRPPRGDGALDLEFRVRIETDSRLNAVRVDAVRATAVRPTGTVHASIEYVEAARRYVVRLTGRDDVVAPDWEAAVAAFIGSIRDILSVHLNLATQEWLLLLERHGRDGEGEP